jgi:hypothetical protein
MTRRNRIRVLGAAALLGGVATIVLLLTASSPVSASPTGISEAQIVAIATTAAANLGEVAPTNIAHSEGTRAAAVAVSSGEVVQGSNDSVLIAEHGHFVGTNVHRPPGAPAPEGSVLTLVVDVSSGEITDLGIQDNYPDLAALGPVTADQ